MLYVFWVLFLGSVLLAFAIGSSPERVVAGTLLAAAVATVLVRSPWAVRYEHIETGVAAVDVFLCVALLLVALRANRFWPMPVASLQLLTVLGHLGKAVNPALHAGGYILLITFPSYAICALLIIGTIRHWLRVRRGAAECSWVASLHR